MQAMLDDDHLLKNWFGTFASSLDNQAEQLLPLFSTEEDDAPDLADFMATLENSDCLSRNPLCRFAWLKQPALALYINGSLWDVAGVASDLVLYVADNRTVLTHQVLPFMDVEANQMFLFELWKRQWLEF